MSTRTSAAKNSAKNEATLDAVFTALGDTTRRRILARLAEGPATVSEIAAPFAMTLAAVSKHIRVLERAGLIRRERVGWYHRCHIETQPFDAAVAFLGTYRPFWEDTLEALARHVEETDAPAKSEPIETPAKGSSMSDGITLVTRRTIRASAARLFDAWTQPEQLRAWWGPAP